MQNWRGQLLRYGLVGLCATFVHVAIAFTMLNVLGTSFLRANVTAFFTAFFVSYIGNAFWSFEGKGEMRSLIKFLVASGINLLLIFNISNWVTESGVSPYLGIMILSIIIPLIGFLVQKIWVFEK